MGKVEDDNPFATLLEDMGKKKPAGKVSLTGLQKKDSRSGGNRLKTTGQANIFDSIGNIITKAAMRNISPGGVGFEINNVMLKPGQKINVEFGGVGLELGLISCTVQWIAPMESHPMNHKMIGVMFGTLTKQQRLRLEMFLEKIRKLSGFSAP